MKIDPKSIGVGQYQHDVDQRKLAGTLDATVESCVNRVGVDLNTASFALLKYVAGITERTAQNIVAYRNQNGRFKSRTELTAVTGLGPKTFEQAAGFLRIRGGENVLDMTAVHPESYAVVERIAQSLGVSVNELIAKPDLVDKVKLEGFQTETVGIYTLTDIRDELKKPGRDPRDKFVAPQWRDDVRTIADLAPGMTLEGDGHQCDQLRRLCGRRRPPGRPGPRKRTIEPLHQGPARSREGRPGGQGEGDLRRSQGQAHRPLDQGAPGADSAPASSRAAT